jgi:RNA polymerase sigma-70 factor (ECF subfamily)
MAPSIAKRAADALSVDGEETLSQSDQSVPAPDDSTADHRGRLVAPGGVEAPDSEELRRLITEHLPTLKACARKLCRNHDDADDVVQDAIVRALQTTHPLRDRMRARSWLIGILTSTFIDRMRRRKRIVLTSEIELPDPVADEPNEPLPWENISNDDVRAAVSSLPGDVQTAYTMFALQGRPYVEIAAKLEIAKATVGTRIHRARKQLRKLLAVHLEKKKS